MGAVILSSDNRDVSCLYMDDSKMETAEHKMALDYVYHFSVVRYVPHGVLFHIGRRESTSYRTSYRCLLFN